MQAKPRVGQVSIALGVALAILVLVTAFLALATPAQASSALVSEGAEQEPVIRARRAISIPYGIDSPLALSDEGHTIEVTGHGTCQEGGETFDVRVSVTQDGTHARARSPFAEHPCVEEGTWSVTAETQGPRALAAGEAEVCGMAVVHVPQGGDVVNRWCKTVQLE